MTNAPFPGHIFRTYDIRGIAGQEVTPELVRALGRALAARWQAEGTPQRTIVGRDCRHTSPDYTRALIDGLTAGGMDVVYLGECSTPQFYHACRDVGGVDATGVMVTASHNPPEYNGFKLWQGRGTLSGEAIFAIRDATRELLEAGNAESCAGGLVCHLDYSLGAQARAVEGLSCPSLGSRPLHVVVDGGNGMGGEPTARALEALGVRVTRLFCEPDGDFPNHHPDPLVHENMAQLADAVMDENADVGFGLDGDGDRLGVVDENGLMLYGDEVLGILAREALEEHPGGLILADVKCTHRLLEDIQARGGQARLAVTGHSVMKRAVRESGAILGGELSGHFYFGHFDGIDDATHAACRLACIIARRAVAGISTADLLPDWPPSYTSPEIRVEVDEAAKPAIVTEAVAHFDQHYPVDTTDGARIDFSNGTSNNSGGAWGLIRASNTEPALVLRFEAETEGRLEEIETEVRTALARWM